MKVGDKTTDGRGTVVYANDHEIAIHWDIFGWRSGWTAYYSPDELKRYNLEFVQEVETKLAQEELNHELREAAERNTA